LLEHFEGSLSVSDPPDEHPPSPTDLQHERLQFIDDFMDWCPASSEDPVKDQAEASLCLSQLSKDIFHDIFIEE
jgi:hypothetical protein